MITVSHLVKKYGDHTAVDDLSFTVERGQIYGFLGPNGAGKSTTMNIMTGYIASTKGEVLIDGKNILTEAEEAKKCIGYLPEQPPLYPDMTVKEYLDFAAELKKVPGRERQKAVAEAMEMVQLLPVEHRLIKNLSKGFKQRVGLAQAVLGDPQILILDEPTVGLDPKQIIEIRELIRELGKKHTVILSSHILSEVSALCDYVMIISQGRLVAKDTPENLSRLAAGEKTLEVVLRGDKEALLSLILEIPGVERAEAEEAKEEENAFLFSIRSGDADIRETLFERLWEIRCPILMMRMVKLSLEDIFLELTQEERDLEPLSLEASKTEESAKEQDSKERGENDAGDL